MAFKDSRPIGVATLKAHATAELADLENGSLWGGGLHVIPEEREKGIGEALAKAVVNIAKQLGYIEIRFYLSEGKGVSWCVERGAGIIETRPFRDHRITILYFNFSSFGQ